MSNDFEISKALLEQNGKLIGMTSGNSMRPLFRDGKDRAVIAPLPETLRKNDVVLYRNPRSNEIVLHRVIKFCGDKPILRGDGLYYTDRNVEKQDFIGIMTAFYRKEKYYDCKKSLSYKLYVFYIRTSYPARRFLHKIKSFFKLIKKKILAFQKM